MIQYFFASIAVNGTVIQRSHKGISAYREGIGIYEIKHKFNDNIFCSSVGAQNHVIETGMSKNGILVVRIFKRSDYERGIKTPMNGAFKITCARGFE